MKLTGADVEVQDAEELKAALSDTLGVKVVVTKRRRLFFNPDLRPRVCSAVATPTSINSIRALAAAAWSRRLIPGLSQEDLAARAHASRQWISAFESGKPGAGAHAKNYSLLLSCDQVRLAPLYDVASALPYGTHEHRLRLAASAPTS